MKIIGFNISKVSAEKNQPIKGKLEVKQHIDLKKIEKDSIPISDKPALKFEFEFTISYNPKIADITLSGVILALDDKDESKEILKQWKKKKLGPSFKMPLFNFILDKCNLKALHLEEELGLPFHIPFPKLRPEQKSNSNPANYAG